MCSPTLFLVSLCESRSHLPNQSRKSPKAIEYLKTGRALSPRAASVRRNTPVPGVFPRRDLHIFIIPSLQWDPDVLRAGRGVLLPSPPPHWRARSYGCKWIKTPTSDISCTSLPTLLFLLLFYCPSSSNFILLIVSELLVGSNSHTMLYVVNHALRLLSLLIRQPLI